jgi:UDP-N-acetyl-D-glucosamine dehydrogenase
VAIIGQGYVGLPLAMAAVDAGWTVIGIDTLQSKVDGILAGISPVEDISNDQLQKALFSGSYSVSTDFSEVMKAAVITICVPTPLDENRDPDLSLLVSATRSIAPHISENTLIVNESTSYPGTLRDVIMSIIHEFSDNLDKCIYFASAPERVNPGDRLWDQRNTPRLLGAVDDKSLKIAMEFYQEICDQIVPVSSPEVAEAAKLLENTYRLVNIALINEFAQVCAAAKINVYDVIEAASTKPYGFMKFTPGVGVGGHCIPVDPLYLTWWAKKNGARASFVENADRINHEMPKYVARRALDMIPKAITPPKILILGVAYKPGVGDVRETPVSELRDHLLAMGAEVFWHDPLVSDWEETQSAELGMDCDLAILATAHPSMDLSILINKEVRILDCTNSLATGKHIKSI